MRKGKVLLTFLLINVVMLVVFSALGLHRQVYLGSCASDTIIVPDDYATIQEAINNAYEGDTIFVRSQTYSESIIVVNRTLKIMGEDTENTVVDGGGTTQFIFHVTANDTIIEKFTLQNTSLSYGLAPAIYLDDVQNATIQKIRIRNAGYGIQVKSSDNANISYNLISNAVEGIHVHAASCNSTIFSNTIEDSKNALTIMDSLSRYNSIYQNNFVNNTEHIPGGFIGSNNLFDMGYPYGGNYWSNYTSLDLKHGPSQNETGSDGILDEAYPDSLSEWDKYPLAHPIINIEVSADGNSFRVPVSSNSTIADCSFNQSARRLTLFVNGPADTNGSCRIAIPKGLLDAESLDKWTISIYNGGGESSNPEWILADEENTYIYFTYNHTLTSRIEMIVVAERFYILIWIFAFSALALIPLKKHLKNRN